MFGGVQRQSGDIFFEIVANRDENTLSKIIRKYVKPGTKIISDGQKSYSNLKEDGYAHVVVNHTENFVDPITKE